MPKHYTRVIRRAPKKRWAAHMEQFAVQMTNFVGAQMLGGDLANFYSLAVSSSDSASPTPVILKTGRYKVQLQCMLDLSTAPNQNPTNLLINAYVVFIPQGWPIPTPTSPNTYLQAYQQFERIITGHPEWIIARKQLGVWTQTPGAPAGYYDSAIYTMSSKLKRNLNSGDQIMLVVMSDKISADDVQAQPYVLSCVGQVTYFTTSA